MRESIAVEICREGRAIVGRNTLIHRSRLTIVFRAISHASRLCLLREEGLTIDDACLSHLSVSFRLIECDDGTGLSSCLLSDREQPT